LSVIGIVGLFVFVGLIVFLVRRRKGRGTGGAEVGLGAEGTKFCTNCGVRISASATFCRSCGSKQD
jgi:hypothetical protein